MTALRQRARQASELGATAVEYAGAIIAAAVLVLALIMAATPIGERLACGVGSAIDKITGGEGYTCNTAPGVNSQYEVDPSEVAKTTTNKTKSTKVGGGAQVGPGKLSAEGTDAVKVTKKDNYDGSGTRSVTTTFEVAVTYELGWGDDNDNKTGGKDAEPFTKELKASGAVALSKTNTETLECGSEGQRSCADVDEANEDVYQDKMNNQGRGRAFNHHRQFDQDVDSTSEAINAKFSAKGVASAKVKDESGVSVGGSVNISGEVGYTATKTKSKDDDGNQVEEKSHRFNYKGQGGLDLDIGGAFGFEPSADGSYAGSYEVTYDDDGNLKTITFESVAEGQGGVDFDANAGKDVKKDGNKNDERYGLRGESGSERQVTKTVTTTLDVSKLDDAERKVAESYVSSSLYNGALLVPRSALHPSEPSENLFENLLYEHGKVTRVTETGHKVSSTGGIDLWLAHWDEAEDSYTGTTTKVEVLDAPGSDGVRSYKESELP